MNIDLFVATKGRKVELANFLCSLRNQTLQNFRVFIGDQNPLPFLADLRTEFTDLPIQWITLAEPSVSLARNVLLENHLTGELFAFPDDDCIYEPDTLEQATAFFSTHLNASICLGEWCAYDEDKFSNKKAKSINRYSCFYRGETFVQFFRNTPVTRSQRFDLKFGFGIETIHTGGEDTDFLLSLIDKNCCCFRVPAIHIHHHAPDFSSADHKRIEQYAEARSALLKKHRMPYFFILLNLCYPLFRMIQHPGRFCSYYAMLRGRWKGYFASKHLKDIENV